jgi:S-methylmethionine-dependent homocysteine/selenocysteine methylase
MLLSSDKLYLTDGGLETVLIFEHGYELPHFASFPLVNDEKGAKILHDYYLPYIKAAKDNGMGFILESATWRASHDWAVKLEVNDAELHDANVNSINLLKLLQNQHATDDCPMVVSGCVGPRGDGYVAGDIMSVDEAKTYHGVQIGSFKSAAVDMVTAITMTNIPEAIGVTEAAQAVNLPMVISFTVETDGTLPSGEKLSEAIEAVDQATNNAPLYYMVNCAHPTHFAGVLDGTAPWARRIQGVRANASRCSHAQLDEAEELDAGNPVELGKDYKALMDILPNLRVMGGCCGTDHTHVGEMGKACSS